MIKDCLEDRIYLIKHPIGMRNPARDDGDPRMMNLGCGIPTVEEVEEVSNLYYGPSKVSRSLHGSI